MRYFILIAFTMLAGAFWYTSINPADTQKSNHPFIYQSTVKDQSLQLLNDQVFIHYKELDQETVSSLIRESFHEINVLTKLGEMKAFSASLGQAVSDLEIKDLIERLNRIHEAIYASPMFDDGSGGFTTYTNMMLVFLEESVDRMALIEVMEEKEMHLAGTSDFTDRLLKISLPKEQSFEMLNIAAEFLNLPGVQFAQPDLIRTAYLNNTLYEGQWYIKNTNSFNRTFPANCYYGSEYTVNGTDGSDINVEPAWQIDAASNPDAAKISGASNGNKIKVAILDTGVDLDHPDLLANVGPGFDAVFNVFGDNGQYDGIDLHGGYAGTERHGTNCAGLVGAANNSIGIKGVAFESELLPIRIGTPYVPTQSNTVHCYNASGDLISTESQPQYIFSDFIIFEAYHWAIDNGADVLTNSWSFGYQTPESDLIEQAIATAISFGRDGKGSAVLFSASNNNNDIVAYPSIVEEVISVGASSLDDRRKSSLSPSQNVGNNCCLREDINFDDYGFSVDGEYFWGSSYNVGLDILSPGVLATTTDVPNMNTPPEGQYRDDFNGTSTACPIAAGVMALILDANPNLTFEQARYALESSAKKVHEGSSGYEYVTQSGQPNGTWSEQAGYGRVDAFAAVNEVNSAVCAGISYMALEGNFHDGSVSTSNPDMDYNYNNNQTCTWTIQPLGAGSIALEFTSFDLAPDDVLYVYEGTDETGQVHVYSGDTPFSEIYDSPALFIKFVTDDLSNGGLGWEVYYTSSPSLTGTTCTEPVVLECGQVYSSSTVNGGDLIDEYSCIGWNESGPERYHLITVDEATTLTASLSNLTSGEDLDVFILDGCEPNNCLDNGNTSAQADVPAGDYYILVDGYYGDQGDYTLSVYCDGAVDNQLNCNQAIDLYCGELYAGSNLNSYNNVNTYSCGSIQNGGEILHRFSTSEITPVTINLEDYSANLNMYLLSDCDPQSCIATGSQSISIPALNPGIYYIVVDGTFGNSGNYDIIVNCGIGEADLTWTYPNVLNVNAGQLNGVATIYNQSCNGTAGSTTVRFYLSRDAFITGNTDELVETVTIPVLEANETYTIDFDINVENINVDYGLYYLGYMIDDDDEIEEANEFNNVYYWSDLSRRVLIQHGGYPNVAIQHGSSVNEVNGTQIDHSIILYNTEPVAAGSFSVGYYLSSNDDISTGDYFLGETNISGLAGGALLPVDFSVNVLGVLPNIPEGIYYIGFILDHDYDVNESNENDNDWYWPSAVQNIVISYQDNCEGYTYLTESSGSVSDGSGASEYENDTYCQWLIDPDENVASITLNFSEFQLENYDDYLYVYDGISVNAPLLASLTGSSIPSAITGYSGRMLLRYETDAYTPGNGWSADYSSVPRTYCNGEAILMAETGVINDGSECLLYHNESNCAWWINPGVVGTQVVLDFEEFELEANEDFLYVFDGDNENAPLLATLTGNDLPDNITSNGESLYLKFSSNESGRYEGFTVSYFLTEGTGSIAGQIMRADGSPIAMTTVYCTGAGEEETVEDGLYHFENLPGGQDYTITPERNFDWKEGVNILDYILVQSHAVGNIVLDSPYKIISADVNHSETVTTIDALLIWQLILNNISEFPENESWRFIPEVFIFPNPQNPWETFFPESIEIDDMSADYVDQNFIGTKIGDVNMEATGNLMTDPDYRSGTLDFVLTDRQFASGDLVHLNLIAQDFEQVVAWQNDFHFDPDYLEFLGVENAAISDFNIDNIGLAELDEGRIATAWTNSDLRNGQSIENGQPILTLKFKAMQSISSLEDIFTIKEDRISAFVVMESGEIAQLGLQWTKPTNFELSAQPNPFLQETMLSFYLDVASNATITVYDLNGRIIFRENGYFTVGKHLIDLSADLFPVSGNYIAEIICLDQQERIHLIHLK